MNTNLFQTLMTVLITVSGLLTSVLLGVGCENVAGTLNCATTTAPAWLAPYLVILASVLGFIKLLLAVFEGKLTKPTVVISASGAPGTVTPAQVASGK